VNELPESPTGAAEAGAEEGIAEFEVDMSEVAREEAAEIGDDVLARVVTGAANTAGTGTVNCFDEAVFARRRLGRFLPTALASTQIARVTATMVTTIVRRIFGISTFSNNCFYDIHH